MKWKITIRFLIVFIFTVFIITFVNLGILTYSFRLNVSKNPFVKVEIFTRSFYKNINFSKEKPYVIQEGLDKLKKYGAWIQILDEDGHEVYSKYKPKNAKKHYSPVEIVHANKYTGVIKDSTVFISAAENKGYEWSYIIGFPQDNVAKHTMYFNPNKFINSWRKVGISIVLITIIGTLFIGYLFGKTLTKPLFNVIDGIKNLSQGNYEKTYSNKGIYKDIHVCMNNLSNTLNKNKNQREKLDKMREEWIENISHDLKTPLASIKGYGEILSDNTYNLKEKEKNKYLNIIMEKSDYMEELLKDLRLTYQLKNDFSMLNKQEINIVDVLTETIIDILNHPDYEDRQINFNPMDKQIFCNLDTKLFSRAITNIIYNSLKHNKIDTIINVTLYKKDKIHIDIEDNGKGISKENLENLFNRYYRGTNTGKNSKGTGLGMAIAKQIIEAHKGTIYVESKLGQGTKVKITL